MKKTVLITGVEMADAGQHFHNVDILIENGMISKIGDIALPPGAEHIEGTGKKWILLPGFIDIHIHGADGFDVMDGTREALSGLANALPREGTTSFLATTMTQHADVIAGVMHNISQLEREGAQAELLGVHLEGPFISPERAGAQPAEHILSPSISLFKEWQQLSGNRIKLTTVAPEAEGGIKFIEELTQTGVTVSIGHTDASIEKVTEAAEAGASHATHLFNQMSPFHHRAPGSIGGVLLNESLTAEVIADFIHSHPQAVELAYKVKGPDRLILITDSMRAKGLAPGSYDLGGQSVTVSEQDARLPDGTLAGSILTMEQAAKNIKTLTNCTLSELAAMTSANAAAKLNASSKGKIQAGKDADLVLVDEDLNVLVTICRGEIAYRKEGIQCASLS